MKKIPVDNILCTPQDSIETHDFPRFCRQEGKARGEEANQTREWRQEKELPRNKHHSSRCRVVTPTPPYTDGKDWGRRRGRGRDSHPCKESKTLHFSEVVHFLGRGGSRCFVLPGCFRVLQGASGSAAISGLQYSLTLRGNYSGKAGPVGECRRCR